MVAIEFIMCSTYSAHTESVKIYFHQITVFEKNFNQRILIT